MASDKKVLTCANDPNFAVICTFFHKFGKHLDIGHPNFQLLQEWLESTDEVTPGLVQLHIKLLRKLRKIVHEKAWETALSKFCWTCSPQDAWEIERIGYRKSSLRVKLRVLRELVECQFERNGKFRSITQLMSANELRSEPVGRDKLGHSYWLAQDPDCNLRVFQEHLDEEIWQVVATNRDELVTLINRLRGNEVVLPSMVVGAIDEDSSSNSCTAAIVKPPPPEERDESQDDEIIGNNEKKCDENKTEDRIPNIKIKFDRIVENSDDLDNVKESKIKSSNNSKKINNNCQQNNGDDNDEEEEAEEEEEESGEEEDDNSDADECSSEKQTIKSDNETGKDESSKKSVDVDRKVKPLIISQSKIAASSKSSESNISHNEKFSAQLTSHKKRTLSDVDNDANDNEEIIVKKARPTLLSAKREKNISKYEKFKDDSEDDDEEEEGEEEEEEEEGNCEEDDETDAEENDDDDVSDAIEEPVMIVKGEGSGKNCNGSFEDFLQTNSECIVSEAIEEQVMFVVGEGFGNDCMVGNTNNNKQTTPPEATFYFGQPGCLKLSPVKSKIPTIKEPSVKISEKRNSVEDKSPAINDDNNENTQKTDLSNGDEFSNNTKIEKMNVEDAEEETIEKEKVIDELTNKDIGNAKSNKKSMVIESQSLNNELETLTTDRNCKENYDDDKKENEKENTTYQCDNLKNEEFNNLVFSEDQEISQSAISKEATSSSSCLSSVESKEKIISKPDKNLTLIPEIVITSNETSDENLAGSEQLPQLPVSLKTNESNSSDLPKSFDLSVETKEDQTSSVEQPVELEPSENDHNELSQTDKEIFVESKIDLNRDEKISPDVSLQLTSNEGSSLEESTEIISNKNETTDSTTPVELLRDERTVASLVIESPAEQTNSAESKIPESLQFLDEEKCTNQAIELNLKQADSVESNLKPTDTVELQVEDEISHRPKSTELSSQIINSTEELPVASTTDKNIAIESYTDREISPTPFVEQEKSEQSFLDSSSEKSNSLETSIELQPDKMSFPEKSIELLSDKLCSPKPSIEVPGDEQSIGQHDNKSSSPKPLHEINANKICSSEQPIELPTEQSDKLCTDEPDSPNTSSKIHLNKMSSLGQLVESYGEQSSNPESPFDLSPDNICASESPIKSPLKETSPELNTEQKIPQVTELHTDERSCKESTVNLHEDENSSIELTVRHSTNDEISVERPIDLKTDENTLEMPTIAEAFNVPKNDDVSEIDDEINSTKLSIAIENETNLENASIILSSVQEENKSIKEISESKVQVEKCANIKPDNIDINIVNTKTEHTNALQPLEDILKPPENINMPATKLSEVDPISSHVDKMDKNFPSQFKTENIVSNVKINESELTAQTVEAKLDSKSTICSHKNQIDENEKKTDEIQTTVEGELKAYKFPEQNDVSSEKGNMIGGQTAVPTNIQTLETLNSPIINRKRRFNPVTSPKPLTITEKTRQNSESSETDLNSENFEEELQADDVTGDIGGKRARFRLKVVNTDLRKKVEAQRKVGEVDTGTSSSGEEERPRKKPVPRKSLPKPIEDDVVENIIIPDHSEQKVDNLLPSRSEPMKNKISENVCQDRDVVANPAKKLCNEKIDFSIVNKKTSPNKLSEKIEFLKQSKAKDLEKVSLAHTQDSKEIISKESTPSEPAILSFPSTRNENQSAENVKRCKPETSTNKKRISPKKIEDKIEILKQNIQKSNAQKELEESGLPRKRSSPPKKCIEITQQALQLPTIQTVDHVKVSNDKELEDCGVPRKRSSPPKQNFEISQPKLYLSEIKTAEHQMIQLSNDKLEISKNVSKNLDSDEESTRKRTISEESKDLTKDDDRSRKRTICGNISVEQNSQQPVEKSSKTEMQKTPDIENILQQSVPHQAYEQEQSIPEDLSRKTFHRKKSRSNSNSEERIKLKFISKEVIETNDKKLKLSSHESTPIATPSFFTTPQTNLSQDQCEIKSFQSEGSKVQSLEKESGEQLDKNVFPTLDDKNIDVPVIAINATEETAKKDVKLITIEDSQKTVQEVITLQESNTVGNKKENATNLSISAAEITTKKENESISENMTTSVIKTRHTRRGGDTEPLLELPMQQTKRRGRQSTNQTSQKTTPPSRGKKAKKSESLEENINESTAIVELESNKIEKLKIETNNSEIKDEKNVENEALKAELENSNVENIEVKTEEPKLDKCPIIKDEEEDKTKGETEEVKKVTPKAPRQRRKREIDTSNIIDPDSEVTPMRQSRRIAQLKIREEAERRKLEEIALKKMKEDLKRKKKEELQEYKVDPTVVTESSNSGDNDDSDVDIKKKIDKKKKKHKKDGWSSGSNEEDDNDDEEELFKYPPSDHGSPLFKSDHEFSPESEIEDESQVVPLKRARTARKEGEVVDKRSGDDEEIDQSCQKCSKSDHPEWILLCDNCDKGYHCSCLSPVLFIIPEGDWFCPPCQQEQLIVALEKHLKEYDELMLSKKLEEEERIKCLELENAEKERQKQREELEAAEFELRKSNKKGSGRNRQNRSRDGSGESESDESNDEGSSNSSDESESRQKRVERRNQIRQKDRKNNRKKYSPNEDGSSKNSASSSDNSDDSENESKSSFSDSDDEPIYKLRKRRLANVSYRFNDYDELINRAIKKDENQGEIYSDEAGEGDEGAGNLGRGKDITTIIEADKEEKARLKQIEEEEKANQNENESETVEKQEDSGKRKSASSKKQLQRKKNRKLNCLDVSSEDDQSDEDFRTSSEEDEDEEESVSASSNSDSSLEVYRRRGKNSKKTRKASRRAARERRKIRDFVVEGSDDSDEEEKPKTKKKRKQVDSDFTESDEDDDDEEDELSEDLDSEELCDDSTDSERSGWRPSKRKKQKTTGSQKTKLNEKPTLGISIGKSPREPIGKEIPKTLTVKKKPKKIENDDEKQYKASGVIKKNRKINDSESSSDDVAERKTRGRRLFYLDDYEDDESSDGGIKPGVKRPDTPPEEREKFIKRQEEIKRMLAEGGGNPTTPASNKVEKTGAGDSLSAVPLSVIRAAKALDVDYLQRKGEIAEPEEEDDEAAAAAAFGDDLPDDFNPDDMDEEAIAKMMEEEDFAQQPSRTLPPPADVIRQHKQKHTPTKSSQPQQLPPASVIQDPLRKRLPMPTFHPLMRPSQPPGSSMPHLPLLQSALTSPVGMSQQMMPQNLSPAITTPQHRQQHTNISSNNQKADNSASKARGRRKKITPLRDPVEKAASVASVSTAATNVQNTTTHSTLTASVPPNSSLPTNLSGKESTPLGISTSVLQSTLSSGNLNVAQPPQIYKPASSSSHPSVITRMPQRFLDPISGNRYFPPETSSPSQILSQHRQPPGSIRHPSIPPIHHQPPSHHSIRPPYAGGPIPLRPGAPHLRHPGIGSGPPNRGPPSIHLGNGVGRHPQLPPSFPSEQFSVSAAHRSRLTNPSLNPYRPPLYGSPGYPPAPPSQHPGAYPPGPPYGSYYPPSLGPPAHSITPSNSVIVAAAAAVSAAAASTVVTPPRLGIPTSVVHGPTQPSVLSLPHNRPTKVSTLETYDSKRTPPPLDLQHQPSTIIHPRNVVADDDDDDGNPNNNPVVGRPSGPSEFSGLVSYFSSQHDEY